jgi:hypothetical protein
MQQDELNILFHGVKEEKPRLINEKTMKQMWSKRSYFAIINRTFLFVFVSLEKK